jgi:hypothetical protein
LVKYIANMSQFNIFAQTQNELSDFFSGRIVLAQNTDGNSNNGRLQGGGSNTYTFSQWHMVNLIDMYINSEFESGPFDAEGQQKLFLNKSRFVADVAAKQTDIDIKDMVFVPEDDQSVWPAYFANKDFKYWAKQSYFGEIVNEAVKRRPRYGSSVIKVVNGVATSVPLRNLRNQQDARDLNTARYVIEEHANMSIHDMQSMPDWDLSGVNMDLNDTTTLYERYGRVPMKWYKKVKGLDIEEGDEMKTVDTMSILILDSGKNKKKKEHTGHLLFIEAVDRRPYEEVHWEKEDGRWLGVGEVEKQIPNQIAFNMFFNFRRRGALWSSKKIFQSTDETINKNFVRDVKDGDVLQVRPNGQVSQVNMTTQGVAEFQSAENTIDAIARQNSFTFEVATGESLPSGTPFRLGVVLSNAVNSHFNMKREENGMFFRRVAFNLLIPQFMKDTSKEHIIALYEGDEGMQTLRNLAINTEVNKRIKKEVLDNGRVPNADAIRTEVTEEFNSRPHEFVKIPESLYKNMLYKFEFDPTGESIDFSKRIETLTNLYQILQGRGDARAEAVLRRLLALTGENVDALLPESESNTQVPQQPAIVEQVEDLAQAIAQ